MKEIVENTRTIQGAHTHSGVGHIMPGWILLTVWAALIFFTYLTVAVTAFDLGSWNLIVAMAIATVKASLVILFFMHLLYDHPFNAVVFITAFLLVSIFVVLVLIDTGQYRGDLIPGYAPGMNR